MFAVRDLARGDERELGAPSGERRALIVQRRAVGQPPRRRYHPDADAIDVRLAQPVALRREDNPRGRRANTTRGRSNPDAANSCRSPVPSDLAT